MNKNLQYLLFGGVFGFVLSRVGASDYNLIFRMFTGEDLKLAYVILTAILTAGVAMAVWKRMGMKGRGGTDVTIRKKPLNVRKNILGGAIFGLGWAISGACPGTVLAQVGEGKLLGLATMLGMILGTFFYALVAERQEK
ncbi:MAG TPA: YeeE/YedE thiosulfate transporter family protein [Bacillota bacterium]|nr:YeeE/YedE thiosulfate transporter family protein [Bacillota bacterium]